MNNKALFKLSYGLYLLTAKEGDKINGCIINTVTQVTDTPTRVSIAVNKDTLTHDMLLRTGKCAVTALSVNTTFDLIKNFGFQSGKDTEKFTSYPYKLTAEGLPYLTGHACAYLVCHVTQTIDLDTHTLFIADVVDGDVLSEEDPLTYDFYHKNIKPAPKEASRPPIKGWRCIICGYVYEGPDLPADFICPWCKHGVIDFEKII